MKTLLLIGIVLAVPAAALAKGPSSATIEGPGLARTAVTDPNALLGLTGIDPHTLDQAIQPLALRPQDDLGPRFTIVYTFGTQGTLRQQVYPFARNGPIVYTQPSLVVGGWFRGGSELEQTLGRLGLPEQPQIPGGGDTPIWPWLVGALALLAALGWTAWFVRARWISAIRTPSVS